MVYEAEGVFKKNEFLHLTFIILQDIIIKR